MYSLPSPTMKRMPSKIKKLRPAWVALMRSVWPWPWKASGNTKACIPEKPLSEYVLSTSHNSKEEAQAVHGSLVVIDHCCPCDLVCVTFMPHVCLGWSALMLEHERWAADWHRHTLMSNPAGPTATADVGYSVSNLMFWLSAGASGAAPLAGHSGRRKQRRNCHQL